MSYISKILFFVYFFILLTGCQQSNQQINASYKPSKLSFFVDKRFTDLDSAIVEISNQLLLNIPSTSQKQNKLILTTFVDLNTLSKTSSVGRIISESLIDELHSKNFKILDFRMQEVITVNSQGEFSLSRDINKLKDEVPEALIVVGTYALIDDNTMVLNARIMNTFTSDVISTAKVIYTYKNCQEFDICKTTEKPKITPPNQIKILDDK
ncbi:MAG: hypothetical protein HY307_04955 [Arcobacter sp.]|nr:hypothetical protein [Arcobacter sp.]